MMFGVTSNAESPKDSLRHQIPLSSITICGVKFGMSKNKCKNILDYKLKQKADISDNESLQYSNVFYASRLFDKIDFWFLHGVLNSIIISIYVGDDYPELTKDLENEYCKILSDKYGLRKSEVSDYGITSYEFGYNPVNKKEPLSHLFYDINIFNNQKEMVISFGPIYNEKIEELF